MNKFKKFLFSGILIVSLFSSSFVFADTEPLQKGDEIAVQGSDEIDSAGEYIKQIMAIIEGYYVGDVSVDELLKGAVAGMAGKLDQYSGFLDEKELDSTIDELSNQNVGLGIAFYENFKDGYPQIFQVYEDSPAEKAGILKDDILISVDGVDMKEKSATQVSETIVSKKDKSIKVIVKRNGVKKELSTVVGEFIVPTVFVSRVDSLMQGLDKTKADKVRYVQISSFEDATGQEFKKTVKKLKAQNVEGIILDLRFNGGGVTQSAYEICEALVKEGPFLNIKMKEGDYTVNSEDNSIPFKNIVVLTNDGSASASELVAAVLKDNGAMIVGGKTYGKGVTQAIIPLEGLGALKMTTEEFSPMSGRKINGIGVVPNYEVNQISLIKVNSENVQKDVEEALIALGYEIETNEKKQAVIKEIQKKYSLSQTGEIDYDTVSAINSEIVNKNFEDDTVFEKGVEVIFNKM